MIGEHRAGFGDHGIFAAALTTGFLYDGADIVQELQGTSSSAPVKAHLLTGGIDEVFFGGWKAINFIDPFGLDARENTEGFLVGFGDDLLLGLGPVMRDWLGIKGGESELWLVGTRQVAWSQLLAGSSLGRPEGDAEGSPGAENSRQSQSDWRTGHVLRRPEG